MASGSCCPVASRAPLPHIEHRAFFGSPLTGRELLSRRADCDIPGADFFGARGPAETVGGRLCPCSLANPEDHRNDEKPRKAHFEHSRRLRPSTLAPNCRSLECGACPRVGSSISRRRLALVEPCPVRPCSAT